MNQEQPKSLSELMVQARTELHMQRDSEALARRGKVQSQREEFTRAWAATFEACAKLLPGLLQPFLRGFPEFKPEEAYNDLPGAWVHFELQIKGLAPIQVWFRRKDVISEDTQWRFDEIITTFRVPLYEKNVGYFGEPKVDICRATDNFGPDSLLLALARAEESEQERLRLQAEVDVQLAERRARQAEREAQSEIQYQHEDPLVARAQRLQVALREFLESVEE